MNRRLFTPGPVELSQGVVEAMSRQPISHKSDEFIALTRDVCTNLQWLCGSTQSIALLAGSGTTAIEATIASLGVRGAPCLVLVHGRFGERIANILTTYGAIVHTHSVEWGTDIAPSAVATTVASIPHLHSVWLVHSETSTGVTLDVAGIADAIRSQSPQAFLCVDAVTSVGIHEVALDGWGLDAVMTGSQKGLCAPPGVGVVALSERARLHAEQHSAVSTVLHLPTTLRSIEQTGLLPWTPPVTVMAALQASLIELRSESRESIWQRHAQVSEALQEGLTNRGFRLFGASTSHAVTVVEHDSPDTIIRGLLRMYGITIAPGQDRLAASVFRLGTCGGVTISDVLYLLDALQHVNAQIQPR